MKLDVKVKFKTIIVNFYLYYNKHTYGALEKAESLIFFFGNNEEEEDKPFPNGLKVKVLCNNLPQLTK